MDIDPDLRNLYFCYRLKGGTLEYRILVNVQENDKSDLYKTESEGYVITKIIANEVPK